jgi:hypothetical protein
VARPSKQTNAELPDQHPQSPEPTAVALKCCRCGKRISGNYIHALAITPKAPDGAIAKAVPLNPPMALCRQCVSDGTNLRVDIEWRQVPDA